MDGSPRQMLRAAGRRLLEKPDRAEQLLTQLVRLQSPTSALVLLRFCLGWCQTSYHARTLVDSLLLCAQWMQTCLMKCLRDVIQNPITHESWLRAQVFIKKEGFDIRHPAPLPSCIS